VKEYWIFLAAERQAEVCRRPSNGTYQEKRLFPQGDTIECGSVPGIRLRIADLSVWLPTARRGWNNLGGC